MNPELEQIKEILKINSYQIKEEKRLGNNTGSQIKLTTGEIINIYDNGTLQFQGKENISLQKLLTEKEIASSTSTETENNRSVFVVYGHDEKAKTELEAMLRRWEINPIFLDQLPSEGQTIIEKLEKYQAQVSFAVVLATPDDVGYKTEHEDEKAFRARQNVVLETGMMLALLGRSKVAILLKDQEKMERPSDIQGLIYIPFKDRVEDGKLLLAKELNAQGISIDVDKI